MTILPNTLPCPASAVFELSAALDSPVFPLPLVNSAIRPGEPPIPILKIMSVRPHVLPPIAPSELSLAVHEIVPPRSLVYPLWS